MSAFSYIVLLVCILYSSDNSSEQQLLCCISILVCVTVILAQCMQTTWLYWPFLAYSVGHS